MVKKEKKTLTPEAKEKRQRMMRLMRDFTTAAFVSALVVTTMMMTGTLVFADDGLGYETVKPMVKVVITIIGVIPSASGAFKLMSGIAERASAGEDDPQGAAQGTKKITSGLIGVAAGIAIIALGQSTAFHDILSAVFTTASKSAG